MNFSVILSLIVTPHLPEVYYSRDQLLTLRSTPAVLSQQDCLFISQFKLCRRDKRGGHRRCLPASTTMTSSELPGDLPSVLVHNDQLFVGQEASHHVSGSVLSIYTLQPVVIQPLSTIQPLEFFSWRTFVSSQHNEVCVFRAVDTCQ